MAYLLGIDPGLHGGLAALDDGGRVVLACPLPALDGDLNPYALATLLRGLYEAQPVTQAAVELVGAMPGQGVVSMFTFGQAVGTILGVLGALGIAISRPRPQAWQERLGIALPRVKRPKGEKQTKAEKAERRAAVKAAALAYVRERWPGVQLVQPGCRVPHDGVVDALCIAAWEHEARSWLA
jgi:crossover junction endodeoxyribonuclease RuvC